MTKEKLISLNKYLDRLNDKLLSSVPPKHVKHPRSFHEFLRHEIDIVKKKIEAAKLEGTGK